MKAAAVLLVLALAGCATPPTVVREPVEVRVPVPVPCVSEIPAAPASRLDALPPGADRAAFAAAALADFELTRADAASLRAALLACKR